MSMPTKKVEDITTDIIMNTRTAKRAKFWNMASIPFSTTDARPST